jgi:pyridoxal phosphate enzyme (YggS family)
MAEEIRDRLGRVRERIDRAARRAGRKAEEVSLIAVSKTIDPPAIQQAVDAGIRDLGENRVQEGAEKISQVTGEGLRWHLIGHLQSNKARLAVRSFHAIQTIDSSGLAARLERIAEEESRHLSVLIQVKLGDEPTKTGADERDLPEIVATLDRTRHLGLRGLMAIPPFFDSPEETRPHFRRLRRTLDKINAGRASERLLTELSMGMSHDFEVAIEEGATMVRVGTAIFGERKTA